LVTAAYKNSQILSYDKQSKTKKSCKIIKQQNKIQFLGISYQNTANPHISKYETEKKKP
jgi:hypothetical protein